jgi:hypothetical protein
MITFLTMHPEQQRKETRFLKWVHRLGLNPEEVRVEQATNGSCSCFPRVVPTYSFLECAAIPSFRVLAEHDIAKAVRLGAAVAFGNEAFREVFPFLADLKKRSGETIGLKGWRGHIGGYDPPPFPPIQHGEQAVHSLIQQAIRNNDPLGIDIEYDGSEPFILGVASPDGTAAACMWNRDLAVETARSSFPLVAYSALEADRPVIEKDTGIPTERERWHDAMLWHFEANRDLCEISSPKTDGVSIGFLGLWTAASLILDWPNWKYCRGPVCPGPCPLHLPLDYCGLDALAALRIFMFYRELDTLKAWGT